MVKQSKALAIFEAAFARPRDARSEEYKAGVLDVLRHRLGEAQGCARKYEFALGTAQADAYFAGCDEGHRLAREHQERAGAQAGDAFPVEALNLLREKQAKRKSARANDLAWQLLQDIGPDLPGYQTRSLDCIKSDTHGHPAVA